MKILIDARVISEKMHGIARYTYNLIKNLSDIDAKNEYVLLSSHDKLIDLFSKYKNFRFVECNTPLYSIQEQFKIPKILKGEDADIYHSPTFSAPIYQPSKTIMTVHDMIHLIFGKSIHRLYYRYIVKTAMVKASRIITVSEYSKADIVKYLGIPKEKINVTYNGIDERFRPAHDKTIDNIKKKYGIFSRYILFVGNQKPHKNVDNILKAFKTAMDKVGLNHQLILVGVKNSYRKTVRELNKRVIHINNYTDDDLIELYQLADLFLSPSLYEGFGLPMLEAMACGIPVVTSNRTSIPEVVGDAAVMVNPENTDEIADAICRVLLDEDLKKDLVKRGLERAKVFSWKKMAEDTISLYERVYEGGDNS